MKPKVASVAFHPSTELPAHDEWVLAFWRHMSPGCQSHGKKTKACGGWFPTRYREGRGWQAQFLSYRCYPRGGRPELWTPLLQPSNTESIRRGEGEHLEWIMRFRFGGTKLKCPACGVEGQFHKLRDRRVYACPNCLHQIAPTAGTILQDTRTPLEAWFRADHLLTERPHITVKELQAFLGVTYKCAWRIRSKIKGSRSAIAMARDSAETA